MRLALIAMLGMVATACGDDSITIASNQDNFCDQIAAVECHNMYQCCQESEIEKALKVSDPRTELQCREDRKLLCERGVPGAPGAAPYYDSLKAGRVTFDPAKLDACLKAIVAPDGVCSQVVTTLPWTDVCDVKNFPWVGAVAPDGQCFYDFDCKGSPDSFCGADQKCKAKPTAGFPCLNGSCASAFYCGTNNTCAPRVAVGGPCTPGIQCEKDLFCDDKGTTVTTDDVCAAKVPGGGTCDTSLGCKSAECVSGKCQVFNNTCYGNTTCQNHCDGYPFAKTCMTSGDCAPGFCSGLTSLSCTSDAACSPSNGTCIGYTYTCVPSTCVGDSVGVCTSELDIADYCTNITNVP